MKAAIEAISSAYDAIIMAAAVADFRPATRLDTKIKKGQGATVIEFVQNPDILTALVANKSPRQIIIGFAAETGDADGTVKEHGLAKLAAKGADLLVINDVSGDLVFGAPNNGAIIAATDGALVEIPYGPKDTLANAVLDALVERLI
jgi:phosphopantothenoylcysteine decarboxylase/phosphopantothenate--cysteine ligase